MRIHCPSVYASRSFSLDSLQFPFCETVKLCLLNGAVVLSCMGGKRAVGKGEGVVHKTEAETCLGLD